MSGHHAIIFFTFTDTGLIITPLTVWVTGWDNRSIPPMSTKEDNYLCSVIKFCLISRATDCEVPLKQAFLQTRVFISRLEDFRLIISSYLSSMSMYPHIVGQIAHMLECDKLQGWYGANESLYFVVFPRQNDRVCWEGRVSSRCCHLHHCHSFALLPVSLSWAPGQDSIFLFEMLSICTSVVFFI